MSADSPTIPVGPGSVCAECGAFYPEIPPEPPWRARDDGAALCSVCGPIAAYANKAWHHRDDPPLDRAVRILRALAPRFAELPATAAPKLEQAEREGQRLAEGEP